MYNENRKSNLDFDKFYGYFQIVLQAFDLNNHI